MWFSNRKQVLRIITRHLLFSFLAIILAGAIIFFVSKIIVRISDSLAQKERLSKVLEMRIENIQQLKNSLALLGDNDKKIQKIYPPADNILEFVSALESIAKQTSVKQTLRFGNFMPAFENSGMTSEKTDYTITLSGTVITLKNYLQLLEKLPFAAKIGGVNLLAAPPNGWNGESSITINGTLYVQQSQ